MPFRFRSNRISLRISLLIHFQYVRSFAFDPVGINGSEPKAKFRTGRDYLIQNPRVYRISILIHSSVEEFDIKSKLVDQIKVIKGIIF